MSFFHNFVVTLCAMANTKIDDVIECTVLIHKVLYTTLPGFFFLKLMKVCRFELFVSAHFNQKYTWKGLIVYDDVKTPFPNCYTSVCMNFN